jgi:glycosyltransferase involved in cell wall biosynthesis
MSIDVSVILPTFNRSGSLPAAISSVLNQSIANLELIVVDDASTEDIKGLVSGIKDDRLRYIRRAVNGGAAAARNTGLDAATGEYVAFQDSDDVWLPGKLETQLALFARLPAAIGVVTGPKILYGRQGGGSPRVAIAPSPKGRLRLDDDQVGRMLEENRLSVQCALFKKSQFPQREWFDSRAKANEDWEFAVRLVQHTRIFEDAEPVVLGFVSSDSISLNLRRQIIGVLRILKQNKAVLSVHRRQRSALMRDVGRSLYKTRKRRWAMRFLLASVADYPPSVLAFAPVLWRQALAGATQRKRWFA